MSTADTLTLLLIHKLDVAASQKIAHIELRMAGEFNMKSASDEHLFLDEVAETYTVKTSSQTKVMRELIIRTFEPFLKGGKCLELGCSDGFMTEALSRLCDRVEVVDGSKKFLEQARQRSLANVAYHYGLFENFETEEKFDHIVASYILEHVKDPIEVLNNTRKLLAPGGKLYVVVPNARALSRQLSVHMGFLPTVYALTPNDHGHGHRRTYDRQSLNSDFAATGYNPIVSGGLMLKILADFQMDQLFDDGFLQKSHADALYTLGLEYPDLCGSLFSICTQND